MARGDRDYTNIEDVRPGTGNRVVDNMYNKARVHGFPRNKPPQVRSDEPSNLDARHPAPLGRTQDHVFNQNSPQAPADQHDKHYDNDATGWVRGAPTGQEPNCRDGDATHKAGFDFKNAWRSESKGHFFGEENLKDHGAVDHNRHWSEFERRHNAGTTHDPMAHDFSKRHVPDYERRGNHDDQPGAVDSRNGKRR